MHEHSIVVAVSGCCGKEGFGESSVLLYRAAIITLLGTLLQA